MLFFVAVARAGVRHVVVLDAAWEETRDQKYTQHLQNLEPLYFERSRERLEGLKLWAAGRAGTLPIAEQGALPLQVAVVVPCYKVRAHVLDVFETLGKPHGGLAFSTHDIPMNTPPENVEEMVRTIKEECFYDA